MTVVKLCASCGTTLINKRSHALTCSNTCRWRAWQAKQSAMISVKLMFSITSYEFIKGNAEAIGVSISDYIHGRVIAERSDESATERSGDCPARIYYGIHGLHK